MNINLSNEQLYPKCEKIYKIGDIVEIQGWGPAMLTYMFDDRTIFSGMVNLVLLNHINDIGRSWGRGKLFDRVSDVKLTRRQMERMFNVNLV